MKSKSNADVLCECLSEPIIRKLTRSLPRPKRNRRSKARSRKSEIVDRAADDSDYGDADGLSEFIEYLASEIFQSLPEELRQISYSAVVNDPHLKEKYACPLTTSTVEDTLALLPMTVADSLHSCGLLDSTADLSSFLAPVLSGYVSAVAAPPPVWATTRAAACEICGRSWVNLTYHHLIPKDVHSKVLKRGLHDAWELNKVAWLCRACHSMVHGIASNEELAGEWYTVERLKSREDVQKFASWVSRVRWKAR